MNDDTAFQLTLQHVDVTFHELLGTAITRWHDVGFPEIRSSRADLLGETDGAPVLLLAG